MKQIITAMGNPQINQVLKGEEFCEIIVPDIQYQDGILEILESNKGIDVLILNSILSGERTIEEFIDKIRDISTSLEIIIILEKENPELKNFLISKGVFNIFYNSQVTIDEIIFLLKGSRQTNTRRNKWRNKNVKRNDIEK